MTGARFRPSRFAVLLLLVPALPHASPPRTPRVEDVEVIADVLPGDPGILWADDFETSASLFDDYHDVSLNGGRFGLSGEDAFGGSLRSVRQQ